MPVPFLWGLGSSNSGLLAALLTLQSTELNSLTNTTVVLSSVGGVSGKFTNNDTGGAVYGELFLTLGAIGAALTAGGSVSGWFVCSPDSGSTYEKSSAALARPPDFLIPLPATTITAGDQFKAAGKVLLPSLQFKVLLQNNCGRSLAASGNTLTLAPISVQF